jgi:hypothetical protein
MLLQGSVLRRLVGGALLRVFLFTFLGLVTGAWVFVRLQGASVWEWALIASAVPATAILLQVCKRIAAKEVSLPFQSALALRWTALATATCLILGLFVLNLGGASHPELPAAAFSHLVSEAMAVRELFADIANRLYALANDAGVPWIVLAATVTMGDCLLAVWAASVAALPHLNAADARRAVLPARIEPPNHIPLRTVGWTSGATSLFVFFVWLPLVAQIDLSLSNRPFSSFSRDATALSDAIEEVLRCEWEQLSSTCYKPGTADQLRSLRERAEELDPQTTEELQQALNSARERLVRGADLFLDTYYTLPAEYLRLAAALSGNLEQALEAGLRRTFDEALDGNPIDVVLSDAKAAEAATLQTMAQEIRHICESSKVIVPPDARIEKEADFPAWLCDSPVLNDGPVSRVIAQAEARGLLSAGAGTIAGALATGVAAKVAGNGALKMAASAVVEVAAKKAASAAAGGGAGAAIGGIVGSIVPGVGTAIGAVIGGLIGGVGTGAAVDAALLWLDEELNREKFRSELLTSIDQWVDQTEMSLGIGDR